MRGWAAQNGGMTSPQAPRSPHALVVSAHGGPDVLRVQPQDRLDPGPDDVLVEVAAAGVNFIDVYQREGRYPVPTPFTLGLEGAGTVIAVGAEVTTLSVGDRVAWAMAPGAAATYAVVPADRCVPVPAAVSDDLAAAALLQGMTAHFLTTSTYAVAPGTTALVHAAAGGVGQLLVQRLVALGATVVATAGGPDKVAVARGRGAQHVVDSRGDQFASALADSIGQATGGHGVDVVYDGVGAATFEASLTSLRPRGMLVIFGAASGPVPPLDVQRLNAHGSLFLTRPSLPHYLATTQELRWRAGEVLDSVASGDLEIATGGRYPLTEAATAYTALESRATTGKLLLVP